MSWLVINDGGETVIFPPYQLHEVDACADELQALVDAMVVPWWVPCLLQAARDDPRGR